ncbi:unnamed protein product [Cuscuta epithymum]|uniref:Small ribosomal subunit protein uS15c n=1 Tax=Cuscuta epithymum TaxID=186058 RepID=A0AAV0FVX8_9ASTE|nr:unnamed protein product [Cuscuta epithymum]
MAATVRSLRLRNKRHQAIFLLDCSFSSSDQPHPKLDYLKNIHNKLVNLPIRNAPPTPHSPPSPSSTNVTFQGMYNRSFLSQEKESKPDASKPATDKTPFGAIGKCLAQLQQSNRGAAPGKTGFPRSLPNLRLRSGDMSIQEQAAPIGSEKLRTSMLNNGSKDSKGRNNVGLVKSSFELGYNHNELGEKLRSLRPDHVGKKNWFSFQELNDRLLKVKEIADKEYAAKQGQAFADMRKAIKSISNPSKDANKQTNTFQTLNLIGLHGERYEYLSSPPKEHLLEKYFDPALMSSAEKMKLELKKVRDEFKLTESDCGSARVQVAQLTTKIKHLSGVLHKKDKHSRKGLEAMVKKRTKMMKYLRRTDWDSYCMVLSKLGLPEKEYYKS